jgi:hypothetical protein
MFEPKAITDASRNAKAESRSQTGAEKGFQFFSATLCVRRAAALICSEMIWLTEQKRQQ